MPRLAVLSKPHGPLDLLEFPLTTPRPKTAALKVRVAGVCGSDVHVYQGELAVECPFRMGHELVAEVAELGEDLATDATGAPLAVGDRVVFPYFWTCGRCVACSRGELHGCMARGFGNYLPLEDAPHFASAHSEYYYTNELQDLFRVPDSLPDMLVAPVNCALAQVIFTLRDLRLGDTIVIQGAGGLGLNATAVARTSGATRIIVIDKIAERLDLADAFGATHCLNADDFDDGGLITEVQRITGGTGADWALEVVGHPSVIPQGVEFLRSGGTLLEIGNVGTGRQFSQDPSRLVYANKSIRGVMTYMPYAIRVALSFLESTQDRFPFSRLFGATYPLDEINEAYQTAITGAVGRVALVM